MLLNLAYNSLNLNFCIFEEFSYSINTLYAGMPVKALVCIKRHTVKNSLYLGAARSKKFAIYIFMKLTKSNLVRGRS